VKQHTKRNVNMCNCHPNERRRHLSPSIAARVEQLAGASAPVSEVRKAARAMNAVAVLALLDFFSPPRADEPLIVEEDEELVVEDLEPIDEMELGGEG
jgi:hypothetical protein